MNKTLTVNIGGIVFHIEEHAYEKLRKYLDAIRAYFTSSDGRDEIMQDIEARIAEMFQEKIKSSQQPILESEVDEVINIMGRPEQFAADSADGANYSTGANSTNYTTSHGFRRLYRDPDDKVIGGVCSGISYRMGIDPIWLRAGFAISFFAFGSGFFLYLILMIIMPKAKTTAEKLEMRGEPVNIENIKKSVADEMGSIKSKVNEFAGEFSKPGSESFGKRTGSFFENVFETVLDILKGLFKFAVKVIAVFMLLLGLIVFGSILIALLAVLGVGGIEIPVFLTNFFLTPSQQFWTFAALFLLVGIPFLMLVYKGIKMLFNIKKENALVKYASGSLILVGLIIGLGLIFSISKNYRYRDSSRANLTLIQPARDTLYIDAEKQEKYANGFGIHIDNDDDFSIISGTLDSIMRIRKVRLEIQKATGDSFELVKVQTGRGSSREDAVSNARKMNYKFEQVDSLLLFDESFTISSDVKFRNQKINLILKVPMGKTIYLDDNVREIIYGIENISNTYDYNMTGHYWLMTPKGLKCTDYDFEQENRDQEKANDGDGSHHITINGKDVDISTDADVKIDKNGIEINDPKNKTHIKLDSDGIRIEEKGKNK